MQPAIFHRGHPVRGFEAPGEMAGIGNAYGGANLLNRMKAIGQLVFGFLQANQREITLGRHTDFRFEEMRQPPGRKIHLLAHLSQAQLAMERPFEQNSNDLNSSIVHFTDLRFAAHG